MVKDFLLAEDKVYIVVLNYNNWEDTLACAESILSNACENYRLVIVDNASTDNSMEYILKWAEGRLESWTPPSHPLHDFSFPPQKKPLDFTLCQEDDIDCKSHTREKIILIQAKENRGYSAGNNIGIKFAKLQNDYAYIWILNNDTVIARDALRHLIAFAKKNNRIGLIGTTLLFYDFPDKIQAFGASFNPFLAVQKHFLAHQTYSKTLVESFDQKQLDYIIGASMFMTKQCIEKTGLMPEEYFLYFEEVDIATSCKKNGLDFAICTDAIVYHKESASIDQLDQKISSFSDFYAIRNRLILTRKYHRYFLPSVYFGLLMSMLLRLLRKDKSGVHNIVRILKTPLSKIEQLQFHKK